jgi:hypothetical protein
VTDPVRVGDDIVDNAVKVGQYAIDLGEKVVSLLDLPPGAFDEVQRKTGLRWMTIILDPLGSSAAAELLVRAAAKHEGLPVPKIDTTAELVRCFVDIPADAPELPKSAGGVDPTNASSTAG